MVVQHNLTAMNSNRMLGLTTASQAKSTERLSSGYKINRAADDAAGLSISEKMRKQIRGLTQASLNAQDGISAVQTAEGALTEVHDMLQRMNELAVKSANGTNSSDDRGYIQDEIDQLVKEIDRVSETTKFNETYLLKGVDKEVTTTTTVGGSATVAIKTGKEFAESYALDTTKVTAAGKFVVADATGTITDLFTDSANITKYVNADGTAKAGYTIYKDVTADETGQWGNLVSGKKVDALDAGSLKVTKTGLMKDNTGAEATLEDVKACFDAVTGSYKGGLYSAKTDGTIVEIGAEQINDFVEVTVQAGTETETTETVTEALTLSLHVGADGNDDNKIEVDIESMSAKGIGVDNIKVDTEDDATASIEILKAAIQKVSEQRSALGAVQNRLEHTINNLDNVVENTTAAESQIRDTDMATEMVKYSNNNILAQAGQAMLAQANQANQGVLSLLG